MASRVGSVFALLSRSQLAVGSAVATGVGGYTLSQTGGTSQDVYISEADKQFRTSSIYPSPQGFIPFSLKYDYPKPGSVGASAVRSRQEPIGLIPRPGPIVDPKDEFPWLNVDFTTEDGAKEFCKVVKEYCWDGFDWKAITTEKRFDIWQNKFREWFHAPWMHWSLTGREPLNGLTFERVIPKGEFSKTQGRDIQNYAVGMYNLPGATTFGKIWADPGNPRFLGDAHFPTGTCVFKILATEATDKEFPNMVGSPELNAIMCPTKNNYPIQAKAGDPNSGRVMDKNVSQVRLVQVDFAVTDPRSPIGWVFGTFMYDGSQTDPNPWDRIIPVGLQWGNDPQAEHEGDPLKECWINPVANDLRESFGGTRPSWGWHGRMNGPADNFISACASCHSTAQRDHTKQSSGMVPPNKATDKERMHWFRNLYAGTPFDPDNVSCDYSLQLSVGWSSYKAWQDTQPKSYLNTLKRMVVPHTKVVPMDVIQERHPQPPTELLRKAPEPEK